MLEMSAEKSNSVTGTESSLFENWRAPRQVFNRGEGGVMVVNRNGLRGWEKSWNQMKEKTKRRDTLGIFLFPPGRLVLPGCLSGQSSRADREGRRTMCR